MKLWAAVGLLTCFLGCQTPVDRSSRAQTAAMSSAPQAVSPQSPELRKRIWVLKPTAEKADLLSLDSLERHLIEAFSAPESAFLAQDLVDQNRVSVVPTADQNPEDITRALKGSGLSGFLVLRVKGAGLAPGEALSEGLIKTRLVTVFLSVDYELYDVSTGRRLATGQERVEVQETRSEFLAGRLEPGDIKTRLQDLSKTASRQVQIKLAPFAEKLGWYGRVVRLEGSRVYLNAGRRSGLVLGDTLKVTEAPRDIVDPATGLWIGEAPGRIKGTLKVTQYFGDDASVAVLQSGGGIRPEDRVELY